MGTYNTTVFYLSLLFFLYGAIWRHQSVTPFSYPTPQRLPYRALDYDSIFQRLLSFRQHHRVQYSSFSDYKPESRNTMLFVVNFHSVFYQNVPFMQEVYFPEFAKHYKYDFDVLFIGPNATDIVMSNHLAPGGQYSYHSLEIAYEYLAVRHRFRYQGYFFMNDDSCVDPSFLNKYDHRRAMGEKRNSWVPIEQWMWNFMDNEQGVRYPVALKRAVEDASGDAFAQKHCPFSLNELYKGWSDFFYVPSQHMPFFSSMEKLFFRHRSFLELTVPNLMACLSPQRIVDCNHGSMPYIETCVHVHPVKFSDEKNRELCMNRIRNVTRSIRPKVAYRCLVCFNPTDTVQRVHVHIVYSFLAAAASMRA